MADKTMEKLLSKKKDKMDPEYKGAKMSALHELQKAMSEMMGDDVKGLKKVTVASDSSEGLKHGLDKAKEALDGDDNGPHMKESPEELEKDIHEDEDGRDEENCDEDEEEGSPEEEAEESPEEEASEGHDMSDEDLDSKIKELEAIKASRKK